MSSSNKYDKSIEYVRVGALFKWLWEETQITKCCGFESQRQKLDGHFVNFFVVKIVMFD